MRRLFPVFERTPGGWNGSQNPDRVASKATKDFLFAVRTVPRTALHSPGLAAFFRSAIFEIEARELKKGRLNEAAQSPASDLV